MLVAIPKMKVLAVPFIEIGFWRVIPSKNSLRSVNGAPVTNLKYNSSVQVCNLSLNLIFEKGLSNGRFSIWRTLLVMTVVSVQRRYTGISITLFVRVSIYTSQKLGIKSLWGLIYPLLLVISHFFVVRFLSSLPHQLWLIKSP